MEIGSIQIVVSVVLILGAAGVALLCDVLNRKNDQLREAMVELQVRREEETHVAVSPTRTVSRVVPPAMTAPPPVVEHAPVEQSVPVAMEAEHLVVATNGRSHGRMNGRNNGRDRDAGDTLVRKPNSGAKIAPDRTAELTSVSGRRQSPAASASGVLPKMDEMNSKEALSDWLNRRRAAARIAETTASQASKRETRIDATPTPVSTLTPAAIDVEQKSEHDDFAQVVVSESTAAPSPVTLPESLVAQTPAPSPIFFDQHSVEIDSALWESLISGTPLAPAPVTADIAPAVTEPQFELIQGAASTSNQVIIPAGMYDQSFLARLLDIKKTFTGLAVSIGINENDGSAPRSEDLMRSTGLFISGLLQEDDFACQSGDDEFLMLCPGPQGAEAQRRLSQISERLWDFQLRGIGTFSILFSWGGIEANNEMLSDAIVSAADRMYQTKRSRKTVSMESANPRRKAV
jgi:hypothetical protein